MRKRLIFRRDMTLYFTNMATGFSIDFIAVNWIYEQNSTPSKFPFYVAYHIQGKITKCWLAETEGIFS